MIDKVKEIHTTKGISQAKLAHLIELSVGLIGNVENPRHIAKYNLNYLNRISKQLEIDFKSFFPDRAI